MAGPAEIRGVFTGSWHETLHDIVYEHIYEKAAGSPKTHPENYPTLPEPLARRAGIAAAVQALWHRRLVELGRVVHIHARRAARDA